MSNRNTASRATIALFLTSLGKKGSLEMSALDTEFLSAPTVLTDVSSIKIGRTRMTDENDIHIDGDSVAMHINDNENNQNNKYYRKYTNGKMPWYPAHMKGVSTEKLYTLFKYGVARHDEDWQKELNGIYESFLKNFIINNPDHVKRDVDVGFEFSGFSPGYHSTSDIKVVCGAEAVDGAIYRDSTDEKMKSVNQFHVDDVSDEGFNHRFVLNDNAKGAKLREYSTDMSNVKFVYAQNQMVGGGLHLNKLLTISSMQAFSVAANWFYEIALPVKTGYAEPGEYVKSYSETNDIWDENQQVNVLVFDANRVFHAGTDEGMSGEVRCSIYGKRAPGSVTRFTSPLRSRYSLIRNFNVWTSFTSSSNDREEGEAVQTKSKRLIGINWVFPFEESNLNEESILPRSRGVPDEVEKKKKHTSGKGKPKGSGKLELARNTVKTMMTETKTILSLYRSLW